jgi:predicted DsbA family dithiol-disulfide isomerase
MNIPVMKIEIWSDIVCPFCYIGKRKFEKALSQFKDKDQIEIEWKSFQLSPDKKTESDKSVYQFLAEHKGLSLEVAKSMSAQVTNSARQVGLEYDFDKAIPANSFNAHRLLHLAKLHDLQDQAEEVLFKAYFTEGKNIDDIPTLVQFGTDLGLDATEVKNMLDSHQYASEVQQDIKEAQYLGLRSVPSFVFDRKALVAGAQDSQLFLEVLEKTFAEWQREVTAK